MNKINNSQFIALMLIGDVFMLFCLSGTVTAMTATGFGLGSLLQLIICLPVLNSLKKGVTLQGRGKFLQTSALVLAVLRGGLLFSLLWSTSETVYIPYEGSGVPGKLLVAGLIAAVCVYISSSGIKALARSALIAAALGGICLAIVTIFALSHTDREALEVTERQGILSQLLRGFGAGGGLSSLVLMLGCTESSEGRRRAGAVYFFARSIISAAVILTAVLICGGIMEITEFPIATAAQLSQPFPVQRIDALFLIAFSVFAVYAVCVEAVTADNLLDLLVPKLKKYRCTVALAAMCGVGFFFGKLLRQPWVTAALAAALPVIWSVWLIFRRREVSRSK